MPRNIAYREFLHAARRRRPDFLQLMRFDRPIGTLLLLWPTLWALWFAADGFPRLDVLAIFIQTIFSCLLHRTPSS